MILPSIKALRSTWPQASIDFLTLENNRNALEAFDLVDSITTIDTVSTARFISSWRGAVSALSDRHYDIIIDFEQFARFSALMAHEIGSRKIIGFRTRGQYRHHLYTDPVEYDDHVHVTRSFFSLAEMAGVTSPFPDDFMLPGHELLREHGCRLLAGSGVAPDEPVVVMHIGTSDNFRERRWLPEYYAHVSDHLAGRYGARTVLTGLAEESFLIAETISHMNVPAAAIDLGGKLDFEEYTALIAAAGMVLSADTAAVHLASAMDVPVIGIYGPNTPRLYGPWGNKGLALYATFDCSPCITNFNSKIHTCRHQDGQGACMRAVSAHDACSAIDRFLDTGAKLKSLRCGA
jgi:ADP-heptose:LPS heptosyltransferase